MPKARKVPITSLLRSSAARERTDRSATSTSGGSSHKATQSTIATFHTLLKRKAQLESQLKACESDTGPSTNSSSTTKLETLKKDLQDVEQEMTRLGGLEGYQVASTLGQAKERGGDSSKVLIEWVKEMGVAGLRTDSYGTDRKLRMLEIGALSPLNHAASQAYIHNTPIDLHSQHPDIQSQDFLQRSIPEKEEDKFDIVSCSLVLNFVPDPWDRGQMLRLIHNQLRPSPHSLLFIVLPSPCTQNSRFFTTEHFHLMMSYIGFVLVKERVKEGGKVGYTLWRWKERGEVDSIVDVKGRGKGKGSARKDPTPAELFGKKKLLNEGKKRNNFTMLLRE